MKTSTRISEMQKFHFGRKIACPDGEAGSLAHVVFDTMTHRLTHLGVMQGHLFGKMVDLPYNTVFEATGDGVMLRIARAELAAASEISVGGAVLDHRSLLVHADSGNKGTLLLIAVHPENGALAYLVVHHLRPGLVTVKLPDAVLNALPPYCPDDELHQEVERILFDLDPLHMAVVAMTEEKKRKVPCSRTDKDSRNADVCNKQPSSQNGKASRIPLPSRLR